MLRLKHILKEFRILDLSKIRSPEKINIPELRNLYAAVSQGTISEKEFVATLTRFSRTLWDTAWDTGHEVGHSEGTISYSKFNSTKKYK